MTDNSKSRSARPARPGTDAPDAGVADEISLSATDASESVAPNETVDPRLVRRRQALTAKSKAIKSRRRFVMASHLANDVASRLADSREGETANSVDSAGPSRRNQIPSAPEKMQNPGSLISQPGLMSAWLQCCEERLPDARNQVVSVRLDENTFVVCVESPVWATRIRMATPSMVAALNKSPGLEHVKKLRIRILPRENIPPARRQRPAAVMTQRSATLLESLAKRIDTQMTPDDDDADKLGAALRRLARRGQR